SDRRRVVAAERCRRGERARQAFGAHVASRYGGWGAGAASGGHPHGCHVGHVLAHGDIGPWTGTGRECLGTGNSRRPDDRSIREVCAVPTALLAAERDAGAHAGIGVSAFGYDGEALYLPACVLRSDFRIL